MEIVRYGKVVAVVERPMKVSGFPKAKNGQPVPETIEVHESKSFLVEPQPLKVVKAVENAFNGSGTCTKHPDVFKTDGYCWRCATGLNK